MSEMVMVPAEPTLEMYEAELRALGVQPKIRESLLARAAETIGTREEPGGVAALRAAIAVGAGTTPVAAIARGWRPRR